MDIFNSNNGSGNTPDNNQYPDKTINESQLPQSGGAGSQLQRSDLPGELSGKTYTTKNLPSGQQREKLGSGTITGVLGEGGMAKVYKTWNEELEIFRAVKILLPDEMGKNTERFMTEMKITANLQHTNIVLIHNIGTWKGLPFIEMELLEGETLEKQIEQHGALPQKRCCSIGIQIAQALAYAHIREIQIYGKKYTGVIHRDLKPSNIMISSDGTIKLMDFGIARPVEIGLHTLDGYLVGTPQYFSPEQMANKNLDGRTDIYSFGVIFYEMLTGKKAFPQDNLYSIMQAIEKSEYKRLKEYDVKINPSLAAFVEKCMHKEREKRFENAAAMLTELQKIDSSLKTATRKGIKRTEAVAEIVKDTAGSGKAAAHNKKYLKPAILIPVLLLILGVSGFLILKPSSHKTAPKPEPVSESPAVVPEPVSPPEPVSVSVSDSIATPGSATVPDSIAAPAPLAETKGMVWIEAGSFMMGSNDGQDDEKPVHKVTLSGFYMDTTEVTQKEYRRVMGKNPSYFKGCLTCPAENITWQDANEYCAKLGKRLPTEAEWEYAARAGSTTTYYWGDQNATYYARFDANSKGRTKPVAGKKPNAWGLYDMSGNVWEWCNDWYGPYPDKSQQNPEGAVTGDSRVLRGGACVSGSSGLGTANRSYDKPDFRANHTGFRCALSR